MPKLLALPALLLTAYVSVALVGCGGSTEPIAAIAAGGGAGLNTGGSTSSSSSSSNGNPQQVAGASTIGDDNVGGSPSNTGQPDGGGPTNPPATSDAGAPSNPDSTSSAFKCGDTSCDGATEYCFGMVGGLNPDQFQCKKLPTGCQATPTCACIAPSVPPAAACPCTETDGLRVSCLLG